MHFQTINRKEELEDCLKINRLNRNQISLLKRNALSDNEGIENKIEK